MFPRNLSLFRFGADVATELAGTFIADRLAEHRVREPGPLEMGASGFASPYGLTDDRLTVSTGGCTGFVFMTYERVLPAASVQIAVDKKVLKIAEDEARKVGNSERKRIREDVLPELMRGAPIKPRRIAGWIDTSDGWVVIDTASRKVAEQVLSALREAFGSFPAVPLAPEEGPRVLMTDWLATATLPEELALGDECELRDPASATGAIVRCRRQELDAEEIKEHLRNGKQAFVLGLTFNERLELTLSESCAVTRLRPLDVVNDTRTDAEDMAMQVQCDLALASLEVRALLAFFERTFAIPRPVV